LLKNVETSLPKFFEILSNFLVELIHLAIISIQARKTN